MRGRSELLAPANHKPGKPLMLRSFYSGRETDSRLQNMLPRLPRVAHYLLHFDDDDLCKLNLVFEYLQVDLMEGRKAYPGFMPSARTMSELVATPYVIDFDVRSPCTRLGAYMMCASLVAAGAFTGAVLL